MERPTHLRTSYRWDLTPRQRQVLELIAAGKTNAEIAEELGISLDGAKYHVREILGKLGVESREEAVLAWRDRQRPLARTARAFGALAAGSATKWFIVGGGAVAAAAVLVVAIVLAPGGRGEGEQQAAATTTPSAQAGQLVDDCAADAYTVVPIARRREGMLVTEVRLEVRRPCRVRTDVAVTVADERGETIADIRGNPATVPIEFEAPAPGTYLVAESQWENWCAEPIRARTQVTAGGMTVTEPPPVNSVVNSPASPGCRDASTPSLLRLLRKEPNDPPALAACNPDDLALRLTRMGAQDARFAITAEATAPCQLDTNATATVLGPDGKPLGFLLNGVVAHLVIDLPTEEPIAVVDWLNWCDDSSGPFELEVAVGGATVQEQVDAPACVADWDSQVQMFGTVPPLGHGEPLPAGLERAWSLPSPLPIWIYEGANPANTGCIDIADLIVPVELAGTAAAKPFECDGPNWRLHAAVDVTGRHYLLGVEVLVLAQVSLPRGGGDGTCEGIRDHLLLASMPLEQAAYATVCNIVPTPPGQAPGHEPIVIWARIRTDMAPPSVPPETPCWRLANYLAAAGESQLTEVQCTLE